mmetsp:Transcript_8924/g.20758  ORF Transcript_8924/g.20758 Transcript_8924/m.20758 type:complete len:315 (+) Transcript_8924:95-1039(+)
MHMLVIASIAAAALGSSRTASAFSPSLLHDASSSRRAPLTAVRLHAHEVSRRESFGKSSAAALAGLGLALPSAPANALVKGNAPPPKKKVGSESEVKCRNVEECQEQAARAEDLRMQQEAERAASGPKPQVVGKTKFVDVIEDTPAPSDDGLRTAKDGDTVEVYFKILKIGKRSFDGLSGEGTVVFSRGYGLEDDEKVPGDRSFKFKLGDGEVIRALNDSVPGMAVGGLRRVSVLPQNGWEKNTKACDGGPGGSGTGGALKTDYVVVPTATMVEQEACFDKAKLPFPATYAQERRMAQRFDQSLIMEVRLVSVA